MKSLMPAVVLSLLMCTSLAQAQDGQLKVGSKGDEIAFDTTQLKAKPNQTVRLTFKNNASPGSRMQHGWVLVRPGTESKVADAGTAAGAAKGYVPDSPDVLAHTRLLNPGESQALTFKAPSAPGSYPYLCPYPGHYLSMKGLLVVQ